jgi:hypothetical protein
MVARLRLKKAHPALKHGGYCERSILPGEKLADFEKLHEDLVDEFQPNGPAEHDVVFSVTCLFWRKQNLETFEVAQRLTCRRDEMIEEEKRRRDLLFTYRNFDESDEEFAARLETNQAHQEARQVAEERARKELGERYELIGQTAEGMFGQLAVEERLDAMIDRCIKRLLTLKGVKSMIAEPPPSLRMVQSFSASTRALLESGA